MYHTCVTRKVQGKVHRKTRQVASVKAAGTQLHASRMSRSMSIEKEPRWTEGKWSCPYWWPLCRHPSLIFILVTGAHSLWCPLLLDSQANHKAPSPCEVRHPTHLCRNCFTRKAWDSELWFYICFNSWFLLHSVHRTLPFPSSCLLPGWDFRL